MGTDSGSASWSVDRLVELMRQLARENELPEHLLEGEITGADTMESLGIDSIGAVAVVDRLEEQIGVLLPDDFLEFEESIAEIAERLNALS